MSSAKHTMPSVSGLHNTLTHFIGNTEIEVEPMDQDKVRISISIMHISLPNPVLLDVSSGSKLFVHESMVSIGR